jgi:hypothetical protein
MNARSPLLRSLACLTTSALITACGAADPADSSASREESLTLGSQYTLVRKTAQKCVDIAGGATANGTQIQQWTCNGSGAQIFSAQDGGNGKVIRRRRRERGLLAPTQREQREVFGRERQPNRRRREGAALVL